MIKVELVRSASGEIVGFAVKGHANAGPHGQDIVCAGVSALTQAAVLGLQVHLRRHVVLDVAAGSLELALADEPDGLTNAILETMVLGLREIARIYPTSVRITEHRR